MGHRIVFEKIADMLKGKLIIKVQYVMCLQQSGTLSNLTSSLQPYAPEQDQTSFKLNLIQSKIDSFDRTLLFCFVWAFFWLGFNPSQKYRSRITQLIPYPDNLHTICAILIYYLEARVNSSFPGQILAIPRLWKTFSRSLESHNALTMQTLPSFFLNHRKAYRNC